MPYFCVSAKDHKNVEAYWLYADTPQAARAAVARSVDANNAARSAEDEAMFDCRPDETKTPPRRMIYRRLNGPIYIAD